MLRTLDNLDYVKSQDLKGLLDYGNWKIGPVKRTNGTLYTLSGLQEFFHFVYSLFVRIEMLSLLEDSKYNVSANNSDQMSELLSRYNTQIDEKIASVFALYKLKITEGRLESKVFTFNKIKLKADDGELVTKELKITMIMKFDKKIKIKDFLSTLEIVLKAEDMQGYAPKDELENVRIANYVLQNSVIERADTSKKTYRFSKSFLDVFIGKARNEVREFAKMQSNEEKLKAELIREVGKRFLMPNLTKHMRDAMKLFNQKMENKQTTFKALGDAYYYMHADDHESRGAKLTRKQRLKHFWSNTDPNRPELTPDGVKKKIKYTMTKSRRFIVEVVDKQYKIAETPSVSASSRAEIVLERLEPLRHFVARNWRAPPEHTDEMKSTFTATIQGYYKLRNARYLEKSTSKKRHEVRYTVSSKGSTSSVDNIKIGTISSREIDRTSVASMQIRTALQAWLEKDLHMFLKKELDNANDEEYKAFVNSLQPFYDDDFY